MLCVICHENVISSVDMFLNKNRDTYVITSSWDKTVKITDTYSKQVVKTLYHDDLVTSASLSPCGK